MCSLTAQVKGKDEIFKRIRVQTLATFIEESSWAQEIPPGLSESISMEENLPEKRPETAADLIHFSEQISVEDSSRKNLNSQKYLLLDLRSKEEYDICHIHGGTFGNRLSTLNCSTALSPHNAVTVSKRIYCRNLCFRKGVQCSHLQKQKNKENKYIIVYDEDESIGSKAATVMFQKGIDNIYLLSGGWCRVFCPDRCRSASYV